MTVSEAVTLIAAITAAIVSILSAVASVIGIWQGNKTHAIVNSQADKFERLSRAAGFAEGSLSLSGEPPPLPPAATTVPTPDAH